MKKEELERKILAFGNEILTKAENERNKVAKLELSGVYQPQYIKDQYLKAYMMVKAEVKQWFDGWKQTYKNMMTEIEEKYSKASSNDPTAELLNYNRIQSRLRAMSADELQEKAKQYLKDGVISSLDELNLFIGELRSRNMTDEADRVRQEAKYRHFAYEPFKQDEQYKEYQTCLTLLNSYGADPNIVYYKTKDGVVESLNLSNFFHTKLNDIA